MLGLHALCVWTGEQQYPARVVLHKDQPCVAGCWCWCGDTTTPTALRHFLQCVRAVYCTVRRRTPDNKEVYDAWYKADPVAQAALNETKVRKGKTRQRGRAWQVSRVVGLRMVCLQRPVACYTAGLLRVWVTLCVVAKGPNQQHVTGTMPTGGGPGLSFRFGLWDELQSRMVHYCPDR